MSDPQTANLGLYLPARGSDSGTWDLPINANSSAEDSLAANVASISLTNSPVTLTTPPTSGASWSGPYQSQSGILRFTGTLSADVTVTIPRAGYFIVQNKCTVGAYAVILASAAPGNVIGVPPGESIHVICDGVDMDFVALGRVNEYEDWAVSTMPRWVSVCTVPPYLNCNGSAFSGTTYPTTAAYLGGTTLPDSKGRARFALNQGSARLSVVAGQGIDGDTLLAGGGQQAILQANLPGVNFTVSGITLTNGAFGIPVFSGSAGDGSTGVKGSNNGNNNTAGAAVSNVSIATQGVAASGGSGASYVPPGYVGGLTVLRAG